MADAVDRAQAHIEREQEASEARARAAAEPPSPVCVRCDDPVEPERYAIGMRHCMCCATAIEAERQRRVRR